MSPERTALEIATSLTSVFFRAVAQTHVWPGSQTFKKIEAAETAMSNSPKAKELYQLRRAAELPMLDAYARKNPDALDPLIEAFMKADLVIKDLRAAFFIREFGFETLSRVIPDEMRTKETESLFASQGAPEIARLFAPKIG